MFNFILVVGQIVVIVGRRERYEKNHKIVECIVNIKCKQLETRSDANTSADPCSMMALLLNTHISDLAVVASWRLEDVANIAHPEFNYIFCFIMQLHVVLYTLIYLPL